MVFKMTPSSEYETEVIARSSVGVYAQSLFGTGFSYATGRAAVGVQLRSFHIVENGISFDAGINFTTSEDNSANIPTKIYKIRKLGGY